MEGARQGKQKGDVQKVQLAVVELVEGLNDRYSHYLLDIPFLVGGVKPEPGIARQFAESKL